MVHRINNLANSARVILIIALAIVAAIVLWSVVAFLTGLVFTVIKFAMLLAVLYVVFLVARSAMRHHTVA